MKEGFKAVKGDKLDAFIYDATVNSLPNFVSKNLCKVTEFDNRSWSTSLVKMTSAIFWRWVVGTPWLVTGWPFPRGRPGCPGSMNTSCTTGRMGISKGCRKVYFIFLWKIEGCPIPHHDNQYWWRSHKIVLYLKSSFYTLGCLRRSLKEAEIACQNVNFMRTIPQMNFLIAKTYLW